MPILVLSLTQNVFALTQAQQDAATSRAAYTLVTKDDEAISKAETALEAYDVKNGFILACQSHPTTERVVIDFDAR